MHRLASCPGVDPPEDVVLVEQPAADAGDFKNIAPRTVLLKT